MMRWPFFKARNLNARAEDLGSIKDGISNGISVIRASIQGLESIESVLKQMKAVAQSAISSPESSTRVKLASQFNELRSQVDNLTEDARFNGVNLLNNTTSAFTAGADDLTVKFNERTDDTPGSAVGPLNQLVVSGVSASDFATIVASSATATGVAGSTTVWGQTGDRHQFGDPWHRICPGDRTPGCTELGDQLFAVGNPPRIYPEPGQYAPRRRVRIGQCGPQ